MQSPASPLYPIDATDDAFAYPTSPLVRKAHQHTLGGAAGTGNKIDYTKFKTKMCRNYLMGLPCPFEERCAFSHGEGDAERLAAIQQSAYPEPQDDDAEETSSSTGSLASPKAALYGAAMARKFGSTDNFFSSNSSTEGNSYSSFNQTANGAAGVTTPRAASGRLSIGITVVQPGHNANAMEFLPPPPPSYEAAVTTMAYEPMSPFSASGKSQPPAYPTRYRHDPYSFTGIIYE